MALNPLVDSRDLRFTLFELLEVDKLTALPRYADFDRGMFEDVIDLAEKIAVEQLYPVSAESEKQGVKYDPATKKVTIPDGFKPALRAYNEAGFIAIPEDPEIGGMGMPACVAIAASEIFTAASLAFTTYPGLTHGAAMLIENFGSDELQEALYPEDVLRGMGRHHVPHRARGRKRCRQPENQGRQTA